MEGLLFNFEQLSLFDQPSFLEPVVQDNAQEEDQSSKKWSDSDVRELRYGMLITAVKEIRDKRKSIAMREEAWNWLFDESDNTPFSANLCARHTGYDIEVLREELLNLIPSL